MASQRLRTRGGKKPDDSKWAAFFPGVVKTHLRWIERQHDNAPYMVTAESFMSRAEMVTVAKDLALSAAETRLWEQALQDV